MKKYVLILTVITLASNLFGQLTESELQLFVSENKKNVENQVKRIREVFSLFQKEKVSYSKYELMSLFSNREKNYLVDVNKISINNLIGSDAQNDWIEILTVETDTFCCSLDYYEYYNYNPSNHIVVINTSQGDYPEGFIHEDVDYYFSNDSLLFVYVKKEENYFPAWDKHFIREERYYYLNNRPIRCLEKEVNKEPCGEIADINSVPNKSMDLITGIEYYEKGIELLNKMKETKRYK